MPRKRRCEPLDRYCERNGLSLAELADKLAIPSPTLRGMVNGNRLVTAKRAVEIEQKIGIPRETLRPDLFVKRAA